MGTPGEAALKFQPAPPKTGSGLSIPRVHVTPRAVTSPRNHLQWKTDFVLSKPGRGPSERSDGLDDQFTARKRTTFRPALEGAVTSVDTAETPRTLRASKRPSARAHALPKIKGAKSAAPPESAVGGYGEVKRLFNGLREFAGCAAPAYMHDHIIKCRVLIAHPETHLALRLTLNLPLCSPSGITTHSS
jgi:hypothetical protein